jgi:hypothetical protein
MKQTVKIYMLNPRAICSRVMNNRNEEDAFTRACTGVKRSTLFEAIKRDGEIKKPLTVFRPAVACPKGPFKGQLAGKIVLIDGHNRLAIAQELGLEEVPVRDYGNSISWDDAHAKATVLNMVDDPLHKKLSDTDFIEAVRKYASIQVVPNPSLISQRLADEQAQEEGFVGDKVRIAEVKNSYFTKVKQACAIADSKEAESLLRGHNMSFSTAVKAAMFLPRIDDPAARATVVREVQRAAKRDGKRQIERSVWESFEQRVLDAKGVTPKAISRIVKATLLGPRRRLHGQELRDIRNSSPTGNKIVLEQIVWVDKPYNQHEEEKFIGQVHWAFRCQRAGRMLSRSTSSKMGS